MAGTGGWGAEHLRDRERGHHPKRVIGAAPPRRQGSESAPMAVLPFAAAPAGTRIVPSPARVTCGVPAHDLRRRAVRGQQPRHRPHRLPHVMEERLERAAQIVEAGIAVRGEREAVLGTPAVAGEADVALPAVPREGVALVAPELLLLL